MSEVPLYTISLVLAPAYPFSGDGVKFDPAEVLDRSHGPYGRTYEPTGVTRN